VYLVLSTVVTAVIGLVLDPLMDALMKPVVVAFLLLINGSMLLFMSKVETEKDITEMKWHNALLVGVAQGIGVFPGISRSGATISGGVFQKFRKDDMAEYAFILFIPVTVGALVLSLDDLALIESSQWVGYLLGFVFSMIFTYLSLKLFLKVIRKKKLDFFAYYCYVVGIVVLIKELLF
jgi:undecaprenyl-diphosphatase